LINRAKISNDGIELYDFIINGNQRIKRIFTIKYFEGGLPEFDNLLYREIVMK
jgi:hypothetical protein